MKSHGLLYLFYGKEDLLIEEAVKQMTEDLVRLSSSHFNVEVFHAPEDDPSQIMNSAYTVPVLSRKRFIIVKETHSFSKSQLSEFIPYLKSPSPTTCLIFVSREVDLNSKFFKEFRKRGKITHFPPLYDREIPSWIKRRVAKSGKNITDEACNYILAMMGSDLRCILNEIEKVTLYVDNKVLIELKDVQQSVGAGYTHSVFRLSEYVGKGNIENALRELHTLLERGIHPLVILKMISRHFRHIWMAKKIVDNGGHIEEIRKDLKIPIGSARSYADQAACTDYKRIPGYFDVLLGCDLDLKWSSAKDRIILEKLIFDLCLSSGITTREGINLPS